MAKAILVLEDGAVFEGRSFGAEGEAAAEVIFNTQVFGYQEILTDPANLKRIVVMGYPHIGNVGINDRSFESDSAHASALIIKEYSRVYSNWQAKESLADYMKRHKVVGIEGIDTRALTVHIRENGEMRGVVSTKNFDRGALLEQARSYAPPSLVSLAQREGSGKASAGTVIIDLGVNNSTLERYKDAALLSYKAKAEQILALAPGQVILSSGPGDPAKLTSLVQEVEKLIGRVRIYGIQNGACVLAMALGCPVSKMKVGHHGVNHPVVDPKSGIGEISVQNHSYGIDKVSNNVKVTHVNLNDKSIEKFETRDGKCVGTLYFPIDERGKLSPDYKLK